jgi:hypothetical protein
VCVWLRRIFLAVLLLQEGKGDLIAMPTVSVDKDRFYAALGKQYCEFAREVGKRFQSIEIP